MVSSVLQCNGQQIATTKDGFLVNPSDWNETVAVALAGSVPILLTDAHWEIIRYIRDYYQKFRHLPNNRMFVKGVSLMLGEAKGNSIYLNALFAGSPVRFACLVAGLPKPPGCF